MERREFIANGLMASAGAVAIPAIGCAPSLRQQGAPSIISEAEADAILARLDAALPAARAARPVRDALRNAHPGALERLGERVDHADAIASSALTGLVIGDAGGAIPTDKAPDDRVRARFEELMPALDEQVIGCTALLSRMPARERLLLDDALRRKPEAPMEIGEVLDAHAAAAGVSAAGRGKLRRIVSQMSARARVQPFSVQLDDYVDKVRRVAAYNGQDVVLAREMAAHAAVGALYAQRTPARWTPSARSDPEPQVVPPARERRGGVAMVTGGVMLSVGGLAWWLGWGVASSGAGLVIGTIGALLAVAGLITLIVGLILYAIT